MPNDEDLKKSLMEDLTKAQSAQTQSAGAIGASDDSMFNLKAMRLKNRKVGEAELAGVNRSIEEAVRHLTTEAGFTNMMEEGNFSNQMNRQLHSLKMTMLRRAGEAQKEMTKRGVDQQKQQAMWESIGRMVSLGSQQAIGQAGTKDPGTPATDAGYQMPEFGSQFSANRGRPTLSSGSTDISDPGSTENQYQMPEFGRR